MSRISWWPDENSRYTRSRGSIQASRIRTHSRERRTGVSMKWKVMDVKVTLVSWQIPDITMKILIYVLPAIDKEGDEHIFYIVQLKPAKNVPVLMRLRILRKIPSMISNVLCSAFPSLLGLLWRNFKFLLEAGDESALQFLSWTTIYSYGSRIISICYREMT
jgi:hypothetical protein